MRSPPSNSVNATSHDALNSSQFENKSGVLQQAISKSTPGVSNLCRVQQQILAERHQEPRRQLTPFHSSTNGTTWTSATIRSTHTFGYTYPEVADNNAFCATQAVNYLYGPSAGKPTYQTLSFKKRKKVSDERWATTARAVLRMGYQHSRCAERPRQHVHDLRLPR